MRVDQIFSEAALFQFLFTLTRISGTVAFLPLPGIKATPGSARLILALAFTIALWPAWSAHKAPSGYSLSSLLAGVALEAAVGLAIGLVVGIAIEVFQAAAQLVSVQAGFAYASTIDPTSGADSPVLVTLAQLVAALLFVCSGADRALFRVLAESVTWNPPGNLQSTVPAAGNAISHFASLILVTGLRLAAPVTVLLLLVDLLLAVFGRLQPQLQLISLTFPLKLSSSLILLAMLVRFYPRFFEQTFGQSLRLIEALLGNAGPR